MAIKNDSIEKKNSSKNYALDEIINELRASNEEEIASDMQLLLDSINLDETQEAAERIAWDESLSVLKKRLVESKLSTLSNSIDVLLSNEKSLSKLRRKDYEQILDKIDDQESELELIRNDLEDLSEQSAIAYAENLYADPKKRIYYDKYIKSRRGQIIQGVKMKVEECGDIYDEISVLKPFYRFVKKNAWQ